MSSNKHQEFGGPLGCFFTYLSTPLLFLLMTYVYHELDSDYTKFDARQFAHAVMSSLGNLDVWKLLVCYFVVVALAYALPGGTIVQGPPTPSGRKLDYKISAMTSLVVVCGSVLLLKRYDVSEDWAKLSLLRTHVFALTSVSTLIAFVWQLAFVVRAPYLSKEERNPLASSGSVWYDSFVGYEHHPRLSALFDLKIYLYRYSMIAWVLMAMFKLIEQYERRGGDVSTEMMLMSASHIYYCYSVYFGDEASCPHMFDIKYEGLGFSQTFGEIVIVPFVYTFTLQLCCDQTDPANARLLRIALAAFLLVVGITMAGISNSQKTKFRTSDWKSYPEDEVVAPAKAGDRAFYCGGLWRYCRHPNYLAEAMTAFGWSLLCGFVHPFAWFYPLFLLPLLVTRTERLEATAADVGETWKRYTARVGYKIVPGLY